MLSIRSIGLLVLLIAQGLSVKNIPWNNAIAKDYKIHESIYVGQNIRENSERKSKRIQVFVVFHDTVKFPLTSIKEAYPWNSNEIISCEYYINLM